MTAIRDQGETVHRNVICCLLVLEIVDYDAKPVFDQIRLTQEFRQLLADATAHATSDDLVSIVREDAALLGFLADPEQCFTTALAIREATLTQHRYRDLPLRIGINLGAVQIAEDEFGRSYVSGEGKQDAYRVMHQGPPRQLSVARPFVELLSRAAPDLAGLLEFQGVFSDTVGPPLCVYRLRPPQNAGPESLPEQQPLMAPAASRPLDSPMQSSLMPGALAAQSATDGPSWLRRSRLRYALVPLLAGAAALTSSSRFRIEAPAFMPVAQLAAATPQVTMSGAVSSGPAPAAAPDVNRSTATPPTSLANAPQTPPAPASRPATPRNASALSTPRSEQRPPVSAKHVAKQEQRLTLKRQGGADEPTEVPSAQEPRPATLFLAVRPWGEVYVDGRRIGVTPPLKSFEVAPGRRLITIRNSSLPAYQIQLTADPEAELTVVHDFACVSDRERPCREGFGKGLELQSRFKLETAEAGQSPHLR